VRGLWVCGKGIEVGADLPEKAFRRELEVGAYVPFIRGGGFQGCQL
jgi:hypothetical protein